MTQSTILEHPSAKRVRNIALGTISLGLLGVAAIAYNAYEQETQRLKIVAGAARAKLIATVAPHIFSLTSDGLPSTVKVHFSSFDQGGMVRVFLDGNENNRIDDDEQQSDGYFTPDKLDAAEAVMKGVIDPNSGFQTSRKFQRITRDLRLIFGQ